MPDETPIPCWEIVLRFEATEDQAAEAAERVCEVLLNSDLTIDLTCAMLWSANDDR